MRITFILRYARFIQNLSGVILIMIEKSSKLDNVRYEIRGPVLDEANRMIADGAKVLKLNIGNPAPFGFTTPEEIIRDMQMNLHDCEGYSDSKGIFSARKSDNAVLPT